MKEGKTIHLDGKDYKLKFTYGSFRLLGELWKLEGVTDVLQCIQKVLLAVGKKGLTFKQEEILADLIWSGLDSEEIGREKILDSGVMLDAEELEKVFTLFAESFAKLGKKQAALPQTKRVKK